MAARERLGRLGVLKLLDELDAKHGKPRLGARPRVAAAVGDGTPCVLLTSDPDDLARLLVDARHVTIEPV